MAAIVFGCPHAGSSAQFYSRISMPLVPGWLKEKAGVMVNMIPNFQLPTPHPEENLSLIHI